MLSLVLAKLWDFKLKKPHFFVVKQKYINFNNNKEIILLLKVLVCRRLPIMIIHLLYNGPGSFGITNVRIKVLF